MYRVFIVLFAICIQAMSAVHELPPFSPLKDIGIALQASHEPNELVPSIEDIIRAHLHPDSPPIKDDIPINNHHLRRLTALSIHGRTFKDFLIFRSGRLDSLRMYNCHIEDFNSILFLRGIEELHLRNCQIKDISSLERIRGLVNLSLTDNHIKNISALSKCRKLTWLDLRNNNIDSVSALRPLRKLTYVDLRNNPIKKDSVDSDIQVIKSNNPSVRILLGKQSISKADLEQQLSVRGKIAEFALCARLQYEDGCVFPFLPHVSEEISEALKYLGEGDDKEYLADIASLLIKYVVELENYYRPGPVLGRGEEPLLDAFLDGVGLKVRPEGVPVVAIAGWICENRDKLAPSLVLDIQIEKRHDLHIKLRQKGIYESSKEGQSD